MEVQSTELKCSLCKSEVNDYCPEFIEQLKTKYGNFKDFQLFYNNFKKDPDSVCDLCPTCRINSWRDKYTNCPQVRPHARTTNAPKNRWSNIILFIITILAFVFGLYSHTDTSDTKYLTVLSENQLKSTMELLENKLSSSEQQQSILKKLNGAFSRLREPGEPIIFMLLHDDASKKTTDCLASYASISAKKHIFTNSSKSLWIDGSEWTSYTDLNQDNLLYEKLTTSLEENEVLVLENLQDLPWSLAKTLHHLCDTENPKFAKAMYMLELRVIDDLKQLSDGQKIVVAERAMNRVWQNAPNEYRAALISRLTSYVDTVLWESDQPCSRESFIRISP
uniref:Transmembrane protein n=1 Tax=Schizaphis graminum TaxID=13262 RepID=A0A2S2PA79_SCHGA